VLQELCCPGHGHVRPYLCEGTVPRLFPGKRMEVTAGFSSNDGGVVYVNGDVAHVINECGPAIKGARELFNTPLIGTFGGDDCNPIVVKVRQQRQF